MKKMISYPKIGQFNQVIRDISHSDRFVGVDENENPIYDDSIESKYYVNGTIKAHGCFSENTPITLANGEHLPIKDIKKGMNVLSYDFDTNEYITNEVKNVWNKDLNKDWILLEFDNNTTIECTMDHKFYTKNRGWVEAQYLNENDEFITE